MSVITVPAPSHQAQPADFDCLITSEHVDRHRATVRLRGSLNHAAAFVMTQVALGHVGRGRSVVTFDLSGAAETDPGALAALRRFERTVLREANAATARLSSPARLSS